VPGAGDEDHGPIYLSLIWHQHQPVYYKDPDTGVYAKPWVRVHAAKDYVDMAATLRKYPGVKATYNLTPSLLGQLDDLAQGAKDIYQVMAEKPAGELTAEDKTFIEARFFDTNPKIIARFPRYLELSADRANRDGWTAADWRDLQVLFNLAWTDPDWLSQEPLKGLVKKGRDFAESDKAIVFERHLELVKEVTPLHRAMQEDGQIEVTMTPGTHPILPLLVNSQLAKDAVPDITLPTMPFLEGQDAVAQLKLGVDQYERRFGKAPSGMWPAEGAVAQEIVGMVSRAGLNWMASDQDVLARSLGRKSFPRDARETVADPDSLYRPYFVSNKADAPVAIVFRDKVISDKVGFTYSGMDGDLAAKDFVRRIHDIRKELIEQGKPGPNLVSVILDGENAWEHYANDGKLFLETLYALLAEDPTIVTTTPTAYLEKFPDQQALDDLWPGSWITPDYATWIGEDEENLAWDYLARARQTLKKYERGTREASPEAIEAARQQIYIAEGSDWFWWYGRDQNSGDDAAFDAQFRATLGRMYDLLGEKRPAWLAVPIIAQDPISPQVGATALISPVIDGAASEEEWSGAGSFAFEGGVMASSKDIVDRIFYGFDGMNLYLRVDGKEEWARLAGDGATTLGFYGTRAGGPANAFSRYGGEQTLLGFGSHALAEATITAGGVSAELLEADGEGGWVNPAPLSEVAVTGKVLELALPFRQIGQPDTGDQLALRLVVSSGAPGARTDITSLPPDRPAQVTVPDLGLSARVLLVEDPEKDDKGPGTYVYPTDGVFPGGAYDLRSFEVAEDGENVLFKFTFSGNLNNSWGAPNGMGIHTLDVYIDQDGVAGSGARLLLPGRNAAVAAEDAWDVAIWAEGWTPGIFVPGPEGPEQAQGTLTITSDPAQKKILVRAPKTVLAAAGRGGSPADWRYLAVVTGQEGFPASGVWRIRDVNATAEQWRFGGAPADTNHTRIIDVALGVGADQFALLSDYDPSQASNMDELAAEDFAILPLTGAGAGVP
jgi:alpha-amylase/alpha-mannosidase (GH57 family)